MDPRIVGRPGAAPTTGTLGPVAWPNGTSGPAVVRIGPGDHGEAVRDLQRRLVKSGLGPIDDPPGVYGPATTETVRVFQERRGLEVDGVCGPQTWAGLVEAGFRLGDRLLYLHAPMLRGDDVDELQLALSALGFHRARVDGIFGPDTRDAVAEFQRNVGLSDDGIAGPDTVAALRRLRSRVGVATPVAVVREARDLAEGPRELRGIRVLVGDPGGGGSLVAGVARALRDAGAIVLTVTHTDGSVLAATANRFDAAVFLGIDVSAEDECIARYFATDGFESRGGRLLAELITAAVRAEAPGPPPGVTGMRLPVLRETRMPAVLVRMGPTEAVLAEPSTVIVAILNALTQWLRLVTTPRG